jgi:integrase
MEGFVHVLLDAAGRRRSPATLPGYRAGSSPMNKGRNPADPPCSPTGARCELQRLAVSAGVGRRFAPHRLRHAHAVEMAREGVPLPVIQRQRGHAHLGATTTYLQGIDTTEIINTVHARRLPVMPAGAGLRL